MDKNSDISECFRSLVMDLGEPVLIRTPTCNQWLAEHENCKDCTSELGCCKSVSLLLVSMTPMMCAHISDAHYETEQASIQDKMDKILAAKTVDEVQAISR